MTSLRKEAETRYTGYRDSVYHVTYESWRSQVNRPDVDLRLYSIEDDALQQCEQLWTIFPRQSHPPTFPWREILNFERRTPRRFELAIWNGSLLCGLVIGRASRSNIGPESNVTITLLQGAPPEINLLKGYIAPIAIDAALAYATILGRPMVYVKDPLPAVMNYYQEFDFKVAKRRCKGLYLGRQTQD